MARCRGPGTFMMPRAKNRFGPFMQPSPGGNCIKGMGNYFGAGMPGDGPRAIRGEVRSGAPSSSFVWIYFSQPIQMACGVGPPWGSRVTIDDPARELEVVSFIILPPPDFDTLQLELDDPVNGTGIEPGDVVLWYYDNADNCLVDRSNNEPIISQGPINCENNLVLEGDFMLLETGGKNIVLVEEDTLQTDGIKVEEAV